MSANEKKIPIWPSDFHIDNNEIWFMHGKINILMKYDMETQNTSVIGIVPGEEIFKENLYANVYKYRNTLILVPCWAREIAIYYIDEERFVKIKLQDIEKYVGKLLFCNVFSYGKYLYCIPYSYRAIVKIDMESFTLEYDTAWVEPTLKEVNNKDFYFNNAAQITDTELALVCVNTNKLFQYDMSKDKMQITKIAEASDDFTTVACTAENIFLYNMKHRNIVVYSIDRQMLMNKIALPEFEGAVVLSTGTDKIICDSLYDHNMLFIDSEGNTEQGNVKEIIKPDKDSFHYSYHHGICKKDVNHTKGFYYFNRDINVMYYFIESRIIKEYKFNISDHQLKDIRNRMSLFYNEPLITENLIFQLNEWLDSIRTREERLSEDITSYRNIGSRIFSSMKEMLQ